MTDDETLKLSRIYRTAVNEIEDVLGVAILGADEQRIIQVLSDAVGSALNVVGQRCGRCDSSDLSVECNHCGLVLEIREGVTL